MSDAASPAVSPPADGFWREAFRRRVPHVFGAYVAATAGIVQFVDWLVDRYALSGTLTDFSLIALVLLLPTVLMLAWRHGQPGRNHWTRVERIGVPVNGLVAAGVLFTVFAGQSFGSTVTTVVVENEDGSEIERVVPKTEFRRHLVLFYFDNTTGDPEQDWLQYGIPRGLWADWRQDFFMSVREGLAVSETLREANRADGLNLPLALKRDIAEEQKVQYFLTGEIRDGDGGLEVATALYAVDGGGPLSERTYRGAPFEVIDQISVEVRKDLGIPSTRLAETVDLPLAELLTESGTAYRDYVDAFRALAVDRDYPAAAEHLARAVGQDSSFALAHWLGYAVATLSGDNQTALQALTAAKRHEYRLPEREQLYVTREYHYSIRQDPAKALAMAERSVAMFPDDLEALMVLALYYQFRSRVDDAIDIYDQMLAVDPSQMEPLRTIGQLLTSRAEYERALEYLGRYAELSPDDMRSYPMLAAAYRGMGEFDAAREACDRALLLEPEDVPALTCLGNVAYQQGQWSEAEEYFEEALTSARTAGARAQVHRALGNYFTRRGQISASLLERGRELEAMGEAGTSPIELLGRRMRSLVPLVFSDRPQDALDSAAVVGALFAPPFENLPAIGEIDIYAALEDPDGVEAAAGRAEQVIAMLGIEALRPTVVMAGAVVLELRGDCEAAIPEYRRAIELEPTANAWKRLEARCLATLGRLDEAAAALEEALVRAPYGPRTLTALARVEIGRGNPEEATERLARALSVWSDADAFFRPAVEARDLLTSLSTN